MGWAVGAVPWELPGAQFPGEKRGKKIKSWGGEGKNSWEAKGKIPEEEKKKIPGEQREKNS